MVNVTVNELRRVLEVLRGIVEVIGEEDWKWKTTVLSTLKNIEKERVMNEEEILSNLPENTMLREIYLRPVKNHESLWFSIVWTEAIQDTIYIETKGLFDLDWKCVNKRTNKLAEKGKGIINKWTYKARRKFKAKLSIYRKWNDSLAPYLYYKFKIDEFNPVELKRNFEAMKWAYRKAEKELREKGIPKVIC